MSRSVGVSAKKVASVAKSQVGVTEKPMGSNNNPYGPSVPWCVIFVRWCFRHAGGRDPLSSNVVTAVKVLPQVSIGSRKTGDLVTRGMQHVGICVSDSGATVAGNHGDAVRNAGGYGWNMAWRPKYAPDIIKLKYGNRTLYYNPETKKLCSDKKGKNPVPRQGVLPGSSALNKNYGSGGGGGGGSSSPSSGSSASKPVPYREVYYTKPKNFKDVKDEVYVSEQPTLIKTLRVETVETDWILLNNLYPDITIPDFTYTYDLSVDSLINEYNRMIKIMAQDLKPFSFISDKECMGMIKNDDNNLGQCFILGVYQKENYNSIYNYYDAISLEWLYLYNDFIMKRDALKAYVEASTEYKTIFTTSSYINTIYKDNVEVLNSKIQEFYNQIQNIIGSSITSVSNSDALKNINSEIKKYELQIKELESQINNKFDNVLKVKKDLEKYNNLKINLEDFKKNFKRNNFSDDYMYWNKDCVLNPKNLNFWLEFVNGANSELSKYSIPLVGDQQLAYSNNYITSVYDKKVPNIIFYTEDKIIQNKTGYNYFHLTSDSLKNLFFNSTKGISAKNQIDELLYEHSFCNDEINITSVPIYYLQPNTRILIYDENTKVNNEYLLNKISYNLNHSGTMALTASIVPQRLY